MRVDRCQADGWRSSSTPFCAKADHALTPVGSPAVIAAADSFRLIFLMSTRFARWSPNLDIEFARPGIPEGRPAPVSLAVAARPPI
jgi:hypothetical protein